MYCFTICYIPSFYVYDVPTNKVIVWCLLICSCHTSLSVYSYLQWCRYTFPVGKLKIWSAFVCSTFIPPTWLLNFLLLPVILVLILILLTGGYKWTTRLRSHFFVCERLYFGTRLPRMHVIFRCRASSRNFPASAPTPLP